MLFLNNSNFVTGEKMDENLKLQENLSNVNHIYVVLSGKGGVGKSTVSANLAVSLALKDKRVGLLDIDLHGPSIPKLLNLENERLDVNENKEIIPTVYSRELDNGRKIDLKVISIGFLLETNKDAVIWRGPLKHSAIKQFLTDVKWGNLDYLIIDSPPGTGDEPLTIFQLLGNLVDGAIVVTSPQDIAISDVRRSITFCTKLNAPVAGIIENFSGFVCPHCGGHIDIFKSGGGKRLAEEMGVPFLGNIPIDEEIVKASDSGKPYLLSAKKSDAVRKFEDIIDRIIMLNE